jgi:hypothetical protein
VIYVYVMKDSTKIPMISISVLNVQVYVIHAI